METLAPPSFLLAVLFPRMGPRGPLLQQVTAWWLSPALSWKQASSGDHSLFVPG